MEETTVSIAQLLRETENIGSRILVEDLSRLIRLMGGRKIGRVENIQANLYAIPIAENLVLTSVKRRNLTLGFGIDKGDHVDAKYPSQMLTLYEEEIRGTLNIVKRVFKEGGANNKFDRSDLERIERKVKLRRQREYEQLLDGAELTDGDLSFYARSGINFKDLLKSPKLEIKKWARELHYTRKTAKDSDMYIKELKELHLEVLDYHVKECKEKSPMDCVPDCDIWKLLHLILYVQEEEERALTLL